MLERRGFFAQEGAIACVRGVEEDRRAAVFLERRGRAGNFVRIYAGTLPGRYNIYFRVLGSSFPGVSLVKRKVHVR